MFRRFLVTFARRAFFVLLLVCLGCSAQPAPSAPPDVVRLLERQVRATYSVPPEVKVNIGPLRGQRFPELRSADHHLRRFRQEERLRVPARQGPQDAAAHDEDRSHEGSLRRGDEEDRRHRPPDARRQGRQGRGRQLRRFPVSVLLAHALRPVSRRCSRSMATAFCSFTRTIRSTRFIPGRFMPRSMRIVWLRRTPMPTGISPTTCTAIRRKSTATKGLDGQNAALDKLAILQGQKHNLDATKLQACVKAQDDKAVRASQKEGDKVGVSATPAMFVNGQKIDGAVPDRRSTRRARQRSAGCRCGGSRTQVASS